jgi:hypothetical protein
MVDSLWLYPGSLWLYSGPHGCILCPCGYILHGYIPHGYIPHSSIQHNCNENLAGLNCGLRFMVGDNKQNKKTSFNDFNSNLSLD